TGITRDQNRFQVYPNPVKQTLFVDYPNPSNLAAPLQLMNELGQVVWQGQVPAGNQTPMSVDLSSFRKGVYYLAVQSDNGKRVKKVVVQ
ncbi:MAG: T9SS type A sorting domain-containing protein, partial [Bacteroidota bacterium]